MMRDGGVKCRQKDSVATGDVGDQVSKGYRKQTACDYFL